MLLLAHTGLTLAIAELVDRLALSRARWPTKSVKPGPGGQGYSLAHVGAPKPASHPDSEGLVPSIVRKIDYRLVLLAALLPDFIDKPLGLIILKHSLGNGKTIGHTLLFSLVLSLLGIYLCGRQGRLGLLTLAYGSFMHLVLDEMWLNPRTLFWPLYGLGFSRGDPAGWLSGILRSLATEPEVYIPEIIGALVLAQFLHRIVRRRGLGRFIRYGYAD